MEIAILFGSLSSMKELTACSFLEQVHMEKLL